MSPSAQAAFGSWSVDPKLGVALLVTALIYARGWRVLHRLSPARFPDWRAFAFLGGLLTLWIAIASPLDAFSGLLLSAHMVQHLLLMSVAPPLILLGAPFLPMLRGLPRAFAHDGLGPFLTWPALQRFGRALTHPVVCWFAAAISLCAWHVPAAFQLALVSPGWHQVEHACFFGSSLLFWWPVVRPFPSRPHWPLWAIPLYLLAFDVVNTGLCALLTFSERVLYPVYETVPRLFGTTALSDQIAAGVIMWVPGSLIFLTPAVWLIAMYLSPARAMIRPEAADFLNTRNLRKGRTDTLTDQPASTEHGHVTSESPIGTSASSCSKPHRFGFDVLAVPFVGRFLRSSSGRRFMQAALLVVALAVMVDGWFGSPVSATNLAGVLPWIYWRGLTIFALLVAGNLFCMACPFMLPRELGRRLGWATRSWPRALRSKWLAIALLALFFWAYEAFDWWDRPAWTAWLVVSYFGAAFVVDAFFRKASFCKYVCPIGQFQFVNSLISPLEVKVREPAVCASCRTHDCLRGNEQQRGCETDLYLPRKAGNLDCTFCLDCVRACPHDNIGLLAAAPGATLRQDPKRAGLGRLSRRLDIAALALVLVFAAFAGAATMAAPVMAWRVRVVAEMGLSSPVAVVTLLFVAALVLAPIITLGGSFWISRAVGSGEAPPRELLGRFSLGLVPLGGAMWAAHFLYHLLAGYGTAWPILQQVTANLGIPILGRPDWAMSGLGFSADTLLVLQTLLLDAGLLLTLYLCWRIAREIAGQSRSALGLLAPWVCTALALYSIGIWTILQPMQMRGMMPPVT
ncbi:MAG: cytochrome c oxidase assembly protein [Chthoniobacteraceae bacterium]